jgi:hypothetical protein
MSEKMPENISSNAPPKSVRTRDIALLACSVVAAGFAVGTRGEPFVLGLWLLSGAFFWGAVLDSALHNPRSSRTVIFVASAMLSAIGIIVIAVGVLVMLPRSAPTRQPALSVPIPPPPAPSR